ncbi:MAG: membrane dipeptidase [Cyclobacteriaceae bacterium]|nr:membrane dipeptidase [Cyclobacteriaceae bacterium]
MTSRRKFLYQTAALITAPIILRGSFPVFAGSNKEYSTRAIDLMKQATVIDMLGLLSLNFPLMEKWAANPELFTAADFERYRQSGINIFHIAVGTGGPDVWQSTNDFVNGWNSFLAGTDQYFMRIDSPGDLDKVKTSGKVGILIGVQNSEHFRTLDDVDRFYKIGQRVSQLTYNARNMIGNGSTERRDEGLSDFGVAIVERMNKVGMAVDVSHCGDKTSLDAFEVSKKPVLVTHSNVRALNPGHPRCKPDEVIKKVGETGSVMGITGVRMFVKGSEPTTVEDALNHFDYVAKLIGPDHVGIGSDIDLDGYDDMPPEEAKRLRAGYKGSYGFREKIDIEGIDHPQRMFDITEGLIRRKYSNEQILGVLGGNFKRVLKQIWSV